MNAKSLSVISIAAIAVIALIVWVTQFRKKNHHFDLDVACVSNLRVIKGGKGWYANLNGLTNGWMFESDKQGFKTLVDSGCLADYPICPLSTGKFRSAEQAAHDYSLNGIGEAPTCKICPSKHILP